MNEVQEVSRNNLISSLINSAKKVKNTMNVEIQQTANNKKNEALKKWQKIR